MILFIGVCVVGVCVGCVHGSGCAWQGACMAGEIVTAGDGTHPTGMHSCLKEGP